MEKENSDWIIGKNALREAIAAEKKIQKVYLSETLEKETLISLRNLCREADIPVLSVPKAKLDSLNRSQHQGVLALISPVELYRTSDLADQLNDRGLVPCLAVLDSVTDVRNFGAIARSAEVFGIHGIIIGTKNSAPVNQESIKSSAGALLRIPLCRENNLTQALRDLKLRGYRIIGAEERGECVPGDMDMNQPLVIVFGSEGEGISRELRSLIDVFVRIPQKGKVASLNVSVSAAILFYEWMKGQRG
ncbi:MAG: 23S rRNA (guanosine(2251)-2'-O)-methyltransferase RlmB [Saprospiraceae bacterium]|nr:23S rRNA (guanosine(2251)-2'-O)-methyltransferase RlmB [Saprospiraceae bacterium]HMW38811.1 23S rRNA (guanosine(2251)-2'-O)-methyltransferase RlmB [Saprospiraceae bacterium]HMX88908.1 23S rRNA (guanosine(2251)-2'-O)-methyltransferase RlmB [Saprospiraceae bacterium]HMZ40313.1 23S rRNA (guanosine(2251)-2'-O)-methyltransferase RlmB [Saprospiraceae bacterium]HNA63333.1 23S rRNA (guanosine(2251)-2'-O)-methyltransferase RlmB [Saprospiraceae bacterium]